MRIWDQYRPVDQGSDSRNGVIERPFHRYDYKPPVLRKPALLSCLAITLAFLGLLQYAVSRLPQKDRFGFPWRDQAAAQPQRSAVLRRQDATPSPDVVTVAISTGNPTTRAGPTTSFGVVPTSNYVDFDQTITIDDGFAEIPQVTASGTSSQDVDDLIIISTSPTDTYGSHTADGSNYVETEKTVAVTAHDQQYSLCSWWHPDHNPKARITKFSTSAAAVVGIPTTVPFVSTAPGESSGRTYAVATSVDSTLYTFYEVTSTLLPSASSDQPMRPFGDNHRPGKPSDVGIITYRWTPAGVFISRYLGVLLVVMYRIWLTMIGNALILTEPFRQLAASSSGVLAERAFFRFYHKRSTCLDPLRALSLGRFALFLVALSCLLACLLPALASEAVWVDTQWDCPAADRTAANPCPARMTVSVTVVRILQGCLAFVALVITCTIWALHVSHTGLTTDPSSNASVQALTQHNALTKDLATMPVGMTPKDLQKRFRGKRYTLGAWKNNDGLTDYGIVTVQTNGGHDTTPLKVPQQREDLTPGRHSGHRSSTVARRSFEWQDFALAVIVAGTFGVVLAYYLDGNDDSFNRFFSSNTFGPRFILTGAGTVISIMWKGVEQQAMITEPFHRLVRDPHDTVAMQFTPTTTPLLSTWRALQNQYWAIALFTNMTLLSEALNVVISGVPFATGQTWLQFLVSAYMSIGILGLMMLGTVFLLVRRRVTPTLPMEPDTLGAKMYLIAKLGFVAKE